MDEISARSGSRIARLDVADPSALLAQLPGWTFHADAGGRITREFTFADFNHAFGFMTQVALAAEKRDHHPEWSNTYRRVTVTWTTHDAGGLTQKDLDMAQLCDAVAARLAGGPA